MNIVPDYRLDMTGEPCPYPAVATLEALPQHFYWQTLHYQVDKHPQGTVEVILYTLGDSKEFIRG